MAKRYIDTSFFKSPFVRGLEGAWKGLYLFIICDCEGSGIWSADFEAASLYVGHKVDRSGFEKLFVKTGKAVDLKNGKYFMPDFVEHQYPTGLQTNNKAHSNFISELSKYQLLEEEKEGSFKPLRRPLEGSYVKVMVKKGKEGVGEKPESTVKKPEIPTEQEFMNYYKSELAKQFPNLEFQLKTKYETWVDQGWKTGMNKPIKNWKLTMKNTISFLKPVQTNGNFSPSTSGPQTLEGTKIKFTPKPQQA